MQRGGVQGYNRQAVGLGGYCEQAAKKDRLANQVEQEVFDSYHSVDSMVALVQRSGHAFTLRACVMAMRALPPVEPLATDHGGCEAGDAVIQSAVRKILARLEVLLADTQ